MIWLLRYISVYLWLTVLFAVPVSFYLILQFTRFGLIISPAILSIFVFVLMGILIGFLMNIITNKRILSLIKEGQAWERSGLVEKAKKKYILALRAYDTFLLSPLSVKKTIKKITGTIAGFHLNNPGENPNFKLGTAVYLKMNPMDADMAGLWLSQISQSTVVTSLEQEVLYVIARAHMGNMKLLPLLANIFIGLHRSDLVAKKIYQQVMATPALAKNYQGRICGLTDEPEESLISRQAVFSMPEQPSEHGFEIKENLSEFVSGLLQSMENVLKGIWMAIRSIGHYIVLFIRRLVVFIKVREKFRFYLKTGVFGLFLAGLVILIVSTLSHTLKTRVIEKSQTRQEKLIPKPLTIQVAAYLTLPHAQEYVDALKKKQIDASIKKVEGGGKTWFVIRVSQFSDKQSATDYGNKLKQQHIIDDFFVNNR